jgi:hypothetical protein
MASMMGDFAMSPLVDNIILMNRIELGDAFLWSAKMMCAAFLGVTRSLAPGDIRGANLPGSASRQHRDVVAPDARRGAVARAAVNPGPISVSSSAVA